MQFAFPFHPIQYSPNQMARMVSPFLFSGYKEARLAMRKNIPAALPIDITINFWKSIGGNNIFLSSRIGAFKVCQPNNPVNN
jgi:hypothetical protein